MSTAIAWFTAALVFAALDAIWLSQMGPRVYRPMVGEMLATQMRIAPAIAFYVIYISGLVFLAVTPALEKASLTHALITGAVVGFIAYGTYDLSNQATLKVWDTRLTIIDMIWGAFLSATASGAAYWAAQRFTS